MEYENGEEDGAEAMAVMDAVVPQDSQPDTQAGQVNNQYEK